MVKLTLIWWRDIPSQVIGQRGRQREKAMLSQRFQEAIDRAAMRAGKGSSEAYIAEWRRDRSSMQTDVGLKDVVRTEIERLESEYSDQRLTRMIRNHGSDSATE